MTKIEELEQRMDEIKTLQKDFEIEINECQKALAELKESKKEGKWKPKEGEMYWFRDSRGEILNEFFNPDHWRHDWRAKNMAIFETREQCERYWHFMDTVKEKSYEFSTDEWEDGGVEKLYITYNYSGDELCVDNTWYYRDFGKIYFKTKEDAQYIIDNFKDELMEYWI